ncbi:hypothetical protein [Bremerella cremea]|uniref:hypothetical protein n=1 Tax=Bremerella cremea TaxID=1031537 RepID=UPI001314CF19|nr:hypothetical protein [Bremerella cremea]
MRSQTWQLAAGDVDRNANQGAMSQVVRIDFDRCWPIADESELSSCKAHFKLVPWV